MKRQRVSVMVLLAFLLTNVFSGFVLGVETSNLETVVYEFTLAEHKEWVVGYNAENAEILGTEMGTAYASNQFIWYSTGAYKGQYLYLRSGVGFRGVFTIPDTELSAGKYKVEYYNPRNDEKENQVLLSLKQGSTILATDQTVNTAVDQGWIKIGDYSFGDGEIQFTFKTADADSQFRADTLRFTMLDEQEPSTTPTSDPTGESVSPGITASPAEVNFESTLFEHQDKVFVYNGDDTPIPGRDLPMGYQDDRNSWHDVGTPYKQGGKYLLIRGLPDYKGTYTVEKSSIAEPGWYRIELYNPRNEQTLNTLKMKIVQEGRTLETEKTVNVGVDPGWIEIGTYQLNQEDIDFEFWALTANVRIDTLRFTKTEKPEVTPTPSLEPTATPTPGPAVSSKPLTTPKPRTAAFIECYEKDAASQVDSSVQQNTLAADGTSIGGAFKSGNYLAYKNVDFEDGQYNRILLKLSTRNRELSGKPVIEVRADSPSGTILGSVSVTASKSENVFGDYYVEIKQLTGVHDIYFVFKADMEVNLDWFTLSSYDGTEETAEEKAAKMQWWKEARFGQFIHFGAYSYTNGVYENPTTGKKEYSDYSAEWMMNRLELTKEEYQNYVKPFNPENFDAKEIVALAKAAGQKYICITTKHHDGYSMYDTKIRTCNDFGLFSWGNNGNYTGVDPIRELKEECEKEGIVFAAYYTVNDWMDPALLQPTPPSKSNTSYKPVSEEARVEMIYRFKEQMRELIVDYGAKVLWFDAAVSWWTQDNAEILEYIKSLNPDIIMNNRAGTAGDYQTPENTIPNTRPATYWESCMVSTAKWGYTYNEGPCKTAEILVDYLVKTASLGGNLLLNQGPRADGSLEPGMIGEFNRVGAWLQKYGAGIYGSDAGIINNLPTGVRSTIKNDKVYLFIEPSAWKAGGTLSIPTFQYPVTGVETIDGTKVTAKAGSKLDITLPNIESDELYNVLVLKIDTNSETAITRETLQQQVDDTKELFEIDYTAESWSDLQTAVKAAEDVLKKTNPSESELKTAYKNLGTAVLELVPLGYDEIDRMRLQTLYNQFDAMKDKENEFTPESWARAEAAYAEAGELLMTVGAMQSQINQAADELDYAMKLLQRPGEPTPSVEPPTPSVKPSSVPSEKPVIGGGGANKPYFPSAEPSTKPSAVPSEAPTDAPSGSPSDFKDINGHWAEKEIGELAEQGVIKGKTEELFMPEEIVTRAEFAAMIRRALELEPKAYQNKIPDILKDTWYADEVQAMIDAGIMSGDADGKFRPDDTMTRQEMAKVIVSAYSFKTGITDITVEELAFDDNSQIAAWAEEFVSKAAALGLITGMENNTFAPNDNMTRAQAAMVIFRLVNCE